MSVDDRNLHEGTRAVSTGSRKGFKDEKSLGCSSQKRKTLREEFCRQLIYEELVHVL